MSCSRELGLKGEYEEVRRSEREESLSDSPTTAPLERRKLRGGKEVMRMMMRCRTYWKHVYNFMKREEL